MLWNDNGDLQLWEVLEVLLFIIFYMYVFVKIMKLKIIRCWAAKDN